jgi:hypothetical protein
VSAGSLLKSSSAAVKAQSSVHLTFSVSAPGTPTERIVADVGTTSGMESISSGKAKLTVEVTPAASYVSGSATGLTTFFDLTAAQAKKLGTDWDVSKAGSADYSTLKSDVTVPSLASLLPKAKGVKVSVDGPTVFVLTWTSVATSTTPKLSNTLRVAAKGSRLPLKELTTDAAGLKVITTLSKWGEPVTVSDPPVGSTIASASITG